jgi:hypothetical protein
MVDAMGNMIAQNFLFDPAQPCPHRRDLRDNVDAVPVVLDHFGEAAHLPLNPAEPLLAR